MLAIFCWIDRSRKREEEKITRKKCQGTRKKKKREKEKRDRQGERQREIERGKKREVDIT